MDRPLGVRTDPGRSGQTVGRPKCAGMRWKKGKGKRWVNAWRDPEAADLECRAWVRGVSAGGGSAASAGGLRPRTSRGAARSAAGGGGRRGPFGDGSQRVRVRGVFSSRSERRGRYAWEMTSPGFTGGSRRRLPFLRSCHLSHRGGIRLEIENLVDRPSAFFSKSSGSGLLPSPPGYWVLHDGPPLFGRVIFLLPLYRIDG